MLKAIYVVNNEPVPVVAKLQKGSSADTAEELCNIIRLNSPPPPISQAQNASYIIKKSGEVYLAAVCEGDGDAMFFVSLLDQLEELLHAYVGDPLTDFLVKDSFALVYRIIDVFVDCGFPLLDDFNAMIQFMPKVGEKGQLNVLQPWRANGITYKRQQLLLDVVEYIDFVQSANGRIDLQQIRGVITMTAEVNGSPKCSFSWKNSPLFDDVAFHRCVDLTNFQTGRRLELVPPHGDCVLAQYRMFNHQGRPPFDLKVALVPTKGMLDLRLTATCEKDLLEVAVKWNVEQPGESTLATKNGKLEQSGEEFTWRIGSMKTGKSAELTGTVKCAETCRQTVFRVEFKIDGSLASGCELGTVQLDGGEAGAFVGAKYETRCGKFQIRAGNPA